MSYLKVPIQTANFTLASYQIMEKINVDTIGPLPVDAHGNQYILVIIDCFSRWIQLYPIKTTQAVEAANALLQWISNFSAPCYILSDNGSQFVNQIIDELVTLVGSEHQLTLAYSHEENGIVERANKTVMQHLRAIVFEENVHTNWSRSIPLVQRIMNSSKHTSTGVAPSTLLYGNQINLDEGLVLPRKQHDEQHLNNLSTYIIEVIKLQQQAIEAAQQHQSKIDDAHRAPTETILGRRKDKPNTITEFSNGTYVLMSYPDSGMGAKPPNKLMTQLKGPLRVESHKGSTYNLRDLVTNKTIQAHVTRLREYNLDEDNVDPRQIANKDQESWDIEKIIAHRGDPTRSRNQLYFRVRWAGFSSEQDTWEPWKNLIHNKQLHNYLRSNQMKRLIPQAYREE
jgi:hypothetical protein